MMVKLYFSGKKSSSIIKEFGSLPYVEINSTKVFYTDLIESDKELDTQDHVMFMGEVNLNSHNHRSIKQLQEEYD
jgi:uncharacterized protein YbaA (DUF1428 family)